MILGLCLILATATICTFAATSTSTPRTAHTPRTARPARASGSSTVRPATVRPATPDPTRARSGPSRRELARRAARLPVRPELATPLDVEFLLSQTLDADAVDRCVAGGAESGLLAPTMWRFADRFGADKLALAVDAETSERTMRWHLEGGTVPDWGPMSLFAALNGERPAGAVPLGDVIEIELVPKPRDEVSAGRRPVAEPIDLSQFADLPPITSPGLATH